MCKILHTKHDLTDLKLTIADNLMLPRASTCCIARQWLRCNFRNISFEETSSYTVGLRLDYILLMHRYNKIKNNNNGIHYGTDLKSVLQ